MKRLQPPDWARPKGYANGVLAEGPFIFVAGQIGWNGQQEFESDDIVDRVRQALENVCAILREGGAGPEDIVRMTWYVEDKHAYSAATREIGEVYQEVIGAHYPAMTLFQVDSLLEDDAQVEIEVTAAAPVGSSDR